MNRQAFIFSLIIAAIIAAIEGYKSTGAVLPPIYTAKIAGKLNKIVRDCSAKGVEFDVQEIQTKTTTCVELFSELGEVEREFEDVKYPESWEDADQVRAYRESRKERDALHMKYFCDQISGVLQCLEPVRPIVDQCQSSEGITLFNFGEQLCKNDGQFIQDFTSTMGNCTRSRDFGNAFETCAFGPKGNGLQAYIRPKENDITPLIYEFCNFGSLARECYQRGIDANPEECAQNSQVLQAFIESVKSGSSNAETVTQCIR